MSTTVVSAELDELDLFQGLAPADLEHVCARLRRVTVPSGTQVMSAEQPGEAVYLILDGSVKIQLVNEDGAEVTLALLGPGDTVGEMSLVESNDRSANVVTVEETAFVWMDRRSFLACLEEVPGLNQNLTRQLSERLRDANQQIRALSTLNVTGRVAHRILAFARRYGRHRAGSIEIPVPLTQSDIAEMVGASRERVNHVVVALKKKGIVSVGAGHQMTVHDMGALDDLCR